MDAGEPHNRCKNRNLAQTNFGRRLCGKPLVGKRQYRQYTQVFNLKDSLISLEFLIHIVNFFHNMNEERRSNQLTLEFG